MFELGKRWKLRMKPVVLSAIAIVLVVRVAALATDSVIARYQQVTIQHDHLVPGIDLQSYILITSNPDKDKRDAQEIMLVKADWPRAMQTKNKALFESILG